MKKQLKSIGSNAGEDYVDDLTTSIVHKYSQRVFEPILKDLEKDESLSGQALHGAISTLKFGLTSAVTISVTNYAMSKIIAVFGTIYAFLKFTNVAGRAKKIVAGVLGSIPFVGRGLSEVTKATTGFLTKDREIIAKMANDNSNNISSIISQERQTQAQIRYYKDTSAHRKISNVISSRSSISSSSSSSSPLTIFTHKMETGGWTTSRKDKSIYQKATGQKISTTVGLSWNKTFINKLNSYSSFAKDSKGQIINLAQAQVDYLANTLQERVN